MADKPLSGIKVVELTTYVAAPICGRTLSDLGASVIKIENLSGDPWRWSGNSMGMPQVDEENPVYEFYNKGKENIALNLKTPAGMEVFFKLLEDADIFITNTREKSLKKLGIDYESLSKRFPALIYGTITGYGGKGPDAGKPGFDNVAFWCVPGYMTDLSYTENTYPIAPATGVGDTVTGPSLAAGILAALHAREKTGKGDFVTVSLYSNAIWTMAGMVIPTQARYGRIMPSSRFRGLPFANNYRGSDGERFMLSIVDIPKQLRALYEVIGRPDLMDDPRFNTSQSACANRQELFDIMDAIIATRPTDEWIQRFQERDIVCSKMGHFSEVCKSEQAWANDYLEEHSFRNGASVAFPTCPIRLDSIGPYENRSAALCGENTVEVLRRLGYSDEEIEGILSSGAANQHA